MPLPKSRLVEFDRPVPESESESTTQLESPATGGETAEGTSESPTATQLAWAAGFLDGEACVHIAKHRHPGRRTPTYRLAVSIAQNSLAALEYFRGSVGIDAPIYKTKRANNHSRQCYTLNFNGRRALELLRALAPYLHRKLEEAQNGFDFWVHGQMGVPGNGQRLDPKVLAIREHYYQRMKKLK